MSVINEMLRDLDRRQGKQPVFEVGSISVVAPTRELPWRTAAIALCVAALVAGSYSVIAPRWQRVTEQMPVAPKAATLAPAAIATTEKHEQQASPPAEKSGVAIKEIVAADENAVTESSAKNIHTQHAELQIGEPVVARENVQKIAEPKTADAEPVRKQLSQTPEALAEEAYRRGALALRDGMRTDAEREFNNALSLLPQHRAALSALVQLYVEDARLDAAEKLLTPALATNPDALDLRQLLARVQLQSGRADAALQTLRARQPGLATHADYYAMLAAIEQQGGDYRAAAEHYRALLNIDVAQASYWLGLALAQDNLQQPDAIDAYRRATTLNNLPVAAREFALQRLHALEANR